MRSDYEDVSRPYLDAIRLAREGAANGETLLRVLDVILEQAPQGDGSETEPVRIFIDAIKAAEAHFVVPA